ncbi:MAG: hypothetical protein CVU44_12510 [Chloroflexi bacterium HGW-Chloroflexi-6]|nr:MAG: hypothetical protein CVU44_12510 [Chloroflexi bacterium HGW-Chloroflexi-6]
MIKRIGIIFFIVLLAFVYSSTVLAQDAARYEIRISQISTLETPDAMVLKTYFNILDPKTSLPALDVTPQSAQVSLPQYNYTAEVPVTRPDVPIYVVLVLDASGSMSGVAADLQKAAKQALENTPNDSFFAVVQFDEEIKLLQDFTQNISAVSFAIDQYKVSNKGTCLYDATFSAVESLQKAPTGRRSIVVFTDGRDENRDGKQCSKHSFQETLNLAMESQVPVNTIGLSFKEGNLNEVELNGLASSTGGFAAIVKRDDLSQAFSNIMDVLKSQWMIQADVYPRRGTSQVLLTVKISDTEVLSQNYSINSNTDYPGPPSPVRAQLDGLLLNAVEQSYDVQFTLTSPELVKYVKIEVWDKSAGAKVGEFIYENPQESNVFQIPTETLTIDRGYFLLISAISKADNTPFEIAREDDKAVKEFKHEFVFDPSSVFPNLQIQSISERNNDLAVDVSLSNVALVGGLDGWLIDEETNTKVEGSDFKISEVPETSGTVIIPLRNSRVPNGKYTIVMRVLSKNEKVFSTATYEGVTYTAATLFERLWLVFVAAPIFLAAVLAVVVAVVLFLMFSGNRQKALSGTPVMGGQLGRGFKAEKSSMPLPLADEEPVRKPQQVAPPRPVASPPVSASPSRPPAAPLKADATLIAGPAQNFADATLIGSAAVPPLVSIEILEGPAGMVRQTHRIKSFPFVIGRNDGDLVIPDPHLSRRHLQISFDATRGVCLVTDLESSNGSQLDSQYLSHGQSAEARSGMLLRLGPNVVLRLDVQK